MLSKMDLICIVLGLFYQPSKDNAENMIKNGERVKNLEWRNHTVLQSISLSWYLLEGTNNNNREACITA